ncbi:MAG: hypothetical protein CM15mP49_18090 [Actinomycetota bacterium]|nr:MAG: hypothetical protein CM15mP49_18090 [Actinomycetota bacterium]
MGLFSLSGVNCHCLIRADLFSKPLMGSWLRKMVASQHQETQGKKLNSSYRKLKAGYAVAIMPEGD